jgi:hypothetical protein
VRYCGSLLYFGTAPVPPVVWVMAAGSAGLMMLLEEGRKRLVRDA